MVLFLYSVYEYYGSIYVKDVDSNDILYELTQPAIIFMGANDPDGLLVTVKIGNKDKVLAHYNKIIEKAKLVPDLLEEYTYADLPLDVDILNKLYNNANFLKTLLGFGNKTQL